MSASREIRGVQRGVLDKIAEYAGAPALP